MPPSPINLGITGAAGRMGRRLIALILESPDTFKLAAALEAPNSPHLNTDAGTFAAIHPANIPITSTIPQSFQGVIIDFSAPAATRALIPLCIQQKIPLVIGTTGLLPSDQDLINTAAKTIPILQAANTGLGINVLLSIAATIARQLGDPFDIEIVEAHHNLKKDAPSGTALALAESICNATGRNLSTDLTHGRHTGGGHDALRKKGTIGMHALRMGDVVGEHTIYFATPGERIELKHTATNRDTFAKGAFRAAQFLAQQKPNRYTMSDVLGL